MSDFSQDEVCKLVQLVHEAISMMEPYYSQSGAADEILKQLEPIELKLPHVELIEPWKMGCPACDKHFYSQMSLAQHMRSKHPDKWTSKQAQQAMRPHIKVWATKAQYLAEANK